MNRIRLLSEQVANQIAAGEVVERPASVVKELVENSLDAQAERITVEIQAGGRSLIRVTDDGVGMSRDDALLSLERHATSKIQSAHDLAEIRTMGFRGEAVPSIASVSRMTITTREREDSATGTQLVIHGGRIMEVKEAGSAPGTCVEVRNLFFNVPGRRKFLRSEETERAHIQHYLSLAALAYPEIAFTVLDDQRVIWQLPRVCINGSTGSAKDLPALQERLRGLYGAELKLLPVDFTSGPNDSTESGLVGEHDGIRVWGFIGAPGISRATRDEHHLFVNRRPVENRGLNFALLEGYHTALMKGRYPVCCLFIEIDPAAVDVNIHPAKREVRFHQEYWVRRMVTQAIRETLLRFHTGAVEVEAQSPTPNLDLAVNANPGPFSATPPLPLAAGSISTSGVSGKPSPPLIDRTEPKVEPRAAEMLSVKPAQTAPSERRTSAPELPPFRTVQTRPSEPLAARTTADSGSPNLPANRPPEPGAPAPAPRPGEPVPLLQVPLRLLGVIGRLYVVLESDRGLVLLDQHAAHERILFEQMLNRMEQNNAASQRLLLPETIELSPRDCEFLREQLSTLSRMGVGLSEFGERTFLLDALPPFVRATDARRFVIELVDSMKASGEGVNSLRLAEHTIAKTVCRHAVKAHDPLSPAELENLVTDLRRCTMPYTCPHGRPTLIEMSFRELEKKFGRAQ